MNKQVSVRQISNGFIITGNWAVPGAPAVGEKFLATLEEVGAFLAETFAPPAPAA